MYNFKNAMHKDKTKIVVTYTNKIQEMEKWIDFNFSKYIKMKHMQYIILIYRLKLIII